MTSPFQMEKTAKIFAMHKAFSGAMLTQNYFVGKTILTLWNCSETCTSLVKLWTRNSLTEQFRLNH